MRRPTLNPIPDFYRGSSWSIEVLIYNYGGSSIMLPLGLQKGAREVGKEDYAEIIWTGLYIRISPRGRLCWAGAYAKYAAPKAAS